MAQTDDFDAPEALLTPSEVAALFRVNPKTVTRWARAGKLTAIRTLGGHRRFRVSEIRRCLEEMSAKRPDSGSSSPWFARHTLTTTNSIDASQATLPLTRAMPEPRPALEPSLSIVVSSSRVSPGTTCARKRALSIPPNSGSLPA